MAKINISKLCSDSFTESTVDTLILPNLGKIWDGRTLNALLQVCFKFRVKHLTVMNATSVKTKTWIDKFRSYAFPDDTLPFLSDLVSITLGTLSPNPVFFHILRQSRIKRINFHNLSTENMSLDYFMNGIFIQMATIQQELSSYGSIREIFFIHRNPRDVLGVKKEIDPFGFLHDNWDKKALAGRKDCRQWIERNQRAWKKCQKNIVTLLGLRRFRKTQFSILAKDVVNIMAGMVWESRGREVWNG